MIAAANVEIEGTDVSALTLHALFARRWMNILARSPLYTETQLYIKRIYQDLDGDLTSRLDFAKYDCEKVKQLMSLDVLLLACRWGSKRACALHDSHTHNCRGRGLTSLPKYLLAVNGMKLVPWWV